MGLIISTPSGGGAVDLSFITATADKILSGYIGIDKEGKKINGTMVNQGTKTASLNAGGSYTIPAGYHSGSGKITANTLASQTSGTATAANILASQTAWVNGVKLTGSMVNQGAKTTSLNAGGSYTIPKGYHSGSGKVTANSLSSQTSATAAAGNILSGKTAWVNGVKITGNIASLAGKTITPSSSQQTVSCSGKYMTGNVIINKITPPPANVIKKGYTYMGVTGTFEGWVPTATDIFYRGAFGYGGYTPVMNNYVSFDLTGDAIHDKGIGSNGSVWIDFATKNNVDVFKYSRISIEGINLSNAKLSLYSGFFDKSHSFPDYTLVNGGIITGNSGGSVSFIGAGTLQIRFYLSVPSGPNDVYIYRIQLS